MAETGSVTINIDEEAIKERVREFIALAWDEGWNAATLGVWCERHEETHNCQYMKNPYRDSE